MDEVGTWYLDDDGAEFDTNPIKDLRQTGHWAPGASELNENITSGCLSLDPSGLLDVQYNSDCDMPLKQACTYKACMTTDGRQCKFPFMFGNATHPVLEYNICSTLDIYRPWCPTVLDLDRTVLEWGDCLEDCPSEPVNAVCRDDPEMPEVSDGSQNSINYTTDFQFGIDMITDEVGILFMSNKCETD